jgi:hypothetical protein
MESIQGDEDWANFGRFWTIVYFGQFGKIYRRSPNFLNLLLSTGKKLCINIDKNGWATFEQYLKNSSGHPGLNDTVVLT